MKKAGKKLEVILYPGEPHTFLFGEEGSPEAVLKCFNDCDAFFQCHIPTKAKALDRTLIDEATPGRKQRRSKSNAA